MNPDDLQRELDKVWQRVSGGPPEAPVGPPSDAPFVFTDPSEITREVSLEAIALIKRQHRAESGRLHEVLEAKERTVRQLGERLAAAENELVGLRRKAQREEERVYQEVFDMSLRLEQAQKAVAASDERFKKDEQLLRAVAEETRRQLAGETARWRELERQWNDREQQYLLDLRELQSAVERASSEAAGHETAARKAKDDLQTAKSAVEKTLAELLLERREREGADRERDKALARMKEVEERIAQLQNVWQEERAQWQELWQRERSSWETKRGELSAWEERLRSEREAWHANLQQLEERETRYASQMAEVLRKSSEAGEQMAGLLQAATTPAAGAFRKLPSRWSARRAAAAAALLVLALAAYPLGRRLTAVRFEPARSTPLAAESATGFAPGPGGSLWLSVWEGEIHSVDASDPGRVLLRAGADVPRPYHPVALAAWGEALYSLDSAQSRIVRHDAATGKFVESSPSPGPAPTALAHDGRNLWSYDAVNRAVYRHLGRDASAEAYRLELDVVPGAMAWHKSELWLYDTKGRALNRFEVAGKELRLRSSVAFPEPVLALSFLHRSAKEGQRLELWVLAAAAPGDPAPALKRYNVRSSIFGSLR